jgi:hypothetical protein
MVPEIKEQWLTDLRSGEFKQGIGRLEGGGKFCCLGVLCFRAWQAGITTREIIAGDAVYGKSWTGSMPTEVTRWAGIDSGRTGGYTATGGKLSTLACDNDQGTPFSEIATTIDQYF